MSDSSISKCAFMDSFSRFFTNVLATLMLPWEIQLNQIKNSNKLRVHSNSLKVNLSFINPTLFIHSGSPCGSQSSAVPGMCPIRSPLQPWQLAWVDERPPCEYHQERPVQGPVSHRGQQTEPEAAVECCQALLPMGRRELFIFFRKNQGAWVKWRRFVYVCLSGRQHIEYLLCARHWTKHFRGK